MKPPSSRINEPDMAALAKGTEAFHRAAKVLDGQLKGAEIRHRRYADARGFLPRRGNDLRRRRASAGRALWRDQALVRRRRRAAGLAEDAGADAHARGDRGLIRVYSGAAASMPAITVTNATASQIRSG